MKKITYFWTFTLILLSFIVVSCTKHVSPAAVEEPVIEAATGVPTSNITLSPAASATATSTGSVTASYTPTNTSTYTNTVQSTATSTYTNTVQSTATSTVTNTTGHGFRLKTMSMSNSGVIGMETTFSYGAGGLTPTAASVIAYDSAGSVSTTSSIGFDFVGNTSSMSVYDSSGNLMQTLVPTVSGGRVVRQDNYDGAGTLMAYTTFQYDAYGNIIRTDAYDASGVLRGSEVKTYNAAGSELTVESYSGVTLVKKVVNTYNASNLMTKTEIYDYGVLSSYNVMDYDGSGRMILVTGYDGANAVTGTATYTYNSAGDLAEIHSVASFMGATMNGDVYYLYNTENLLVEINSTQSMSGITMMTMRVAMTYEAY